MDEQLEYGMATAIFVLDHTAEKMSPEDAERGFSETSKENFRRMWPSVREWGEKLWQLLEDERGAMSRPVQDEELDDVGGGG